MNTQNKTHSTPLHLTSSRGNAKLVRVLIEQGADVNARDGSQKTPLDLASSSSGAKTALQFLEYLASSQVSGEDV